MGIVIFDCFSRMYEIDVLFLFSSSRKATHNNDEYAMMFYVPFFF
jgi:hypothetical protein